MSADSRQFYTQLNIGTAKPSVSQLEEVKHYFINTKNISELYGAGHYEKDAIELLDKLFIEKDIVFMVGGSGLFINAVLKGVDDFIEIPSEVRENLNQKFEELGIKWLQNKLKELDVNYYNSVDINNPQRMIRALEVSSYTGKPYSSFLNNNVPSRNFIPIKILLNTERDKLYKNINSRVDEMMAGGLLDEVKSLKDYKELNALKTVGYKELFAFLDASYSLTTAIEKIKQHTRNYAKRQITWFNNQDEFEKFEPDAIEKIKAYIDIIIKHG